LTRPTSRSRATGSIYIARLTRPARRSISCCEPETVTIDKSGANLAALEALNAERDTPIKIRQNKYLNNIVEQDHRAIKRRTRPMLGFKTFRCARILPGGIELMHMVAKGQMKDSGSWRTPAEQSYSLIK
jgi:putative transposase